MAPRPRGRPGDGPAALEELLAFLRRELRKRGAVALHGDRRTAFVSALCAAHLHESRGADPAAALAEAAEAGLETGPEACELVGVRPAELERLLSAG